MMRAQSLVIVALLCAWSIAISEAILADATVEMRDGAPVLMVDGQAAAPVIYRQNVPYNIRASHIEHYRHMAAAGVQIFWVPMGIGYLQDRATREVNWGKFVDPAIEETLDATGPDSRILLMIPTALRRGSYAKWADENPDEMMVWPPGMTSGDRASLSSAKYRQMATEGLADLVDYIENGPFGDRVIGYFLCGGGGEWLDYWDYSPAALRSFRAWLQRKYGEEAALREAWADAKVTFASAQFPEWAKFEKADLGIFRDPLRSRPIIDYQQFYHEELASAASEFAAAVKKSCGQKLVGMWNGYYFFPSWSPPISGTFRRRQGAFDTLVKDPNIDFFMAPYNYRERHPGGVYLPQFLNDTMRLNGKLAIVEEDSRTALAALAEDRYHPLRSDSAYSTIGDCFGRCQTIEESVAVMARNAAGIFSKPGVGVSWYCLGNAGGWYEDARLQEMAGKIQQLATEKPAKRSLSQVAVIVSNRSLWYQGLNDFTPEVTIRQATEGLSHMGAPFDVYLDSDLSNPDFPWDQYKMVVLLNTYYLQNAPIVREKIRTGKTLVSLYAAGFVQDAELSTEGISDLTGMNIEMANVTLERGAQVDLGGGRQYGTGRRFGPVLWCDDPEAEYLGDLVATDSAGGVFTLCKRGGLARRTFDTWTSVWSAVPNIPANVFRELAQDAGVHIYDDAGDAVYAGENLLGVHTLQGGERTLRLPTAQRVTDMLSGEVVCDGAAEFTVTLPPRGTGLYMLE